MVRRVFRRLLKDALALVRGRATDDELSDELDTFLEASVAHKMQSGMSRADALRTARPEIGSPLAVRDAVRDVRWSTAWETTWRDVRYGIRSLARNGSFTVAAVTTLALGVGVTTAVFSIVNTVLLEPLPYRDSGRLVRIVERAAPRTAGDPLQVATATVLLVGAGLLINSFDRLTRVDPGWNASGLLTFYLAAPQEYTTQRKAMLVDNVLGELRRTPGVQGAGFTYGGPLLGLTDYVGKFLPAGRAPEDMPEIPTGPHIRSVSHDFLQTMEVRLQAGRFLESRDDAGAPPVIVVNRSLARVFFGAEDPVGRMVHLDGRMDFPAQQIVGVVDDMRQGRLDQEPTPQFFVDYRQVLALTQARKMPVPQQERLAFGFLSFVVRTDGDPARLMTTMRSLIARVDPNVGIDAMLPMDQLVASSLTRQRFYASVMGVFAAIAVLLSAVGIYGVLAYAVGQRTREFGVRTALGARSRDVLAMVLRQGLGLAATGIAIGLAGAIAFTQYIGGMLYDVTPLDPPTYVAVAVLFAAVSAIASYVPARRATKIDPLRALRYE